MPWLWLARLAGAGWRLSGALAALWRGWLALAQAGAGNPLRTAQNPARSRFSLACASSCAEKPLRPDGFDVKPLVKKKCQFAGKKKVFGKKLAIRPDMPPNGPRAGCHGPPENGIPPDLPSRKAAGFSRVRV